MKVVLTGIVLLVLALWVGIYIDDGEWEHECPLPTKRELQERLGVKVDGVIGDETKEAWDKYICDQYAIEDYEKTFGKGE